ncbi:hypothetical protein [Kangiella sediminilitoris]|uniref:Uncharacterized protein n=1 Tax=Kangiella sediminilitoris TaxID=1144748 RepID=A0A1B3BCA7_9GAMM|nr:hypothetical protein [Kangiella sediminilitoris]AOE50367.1 hypothetical protein KS2013_1657 [Kangiella sediminilitoris]
MPLPWKKWIIQYAMMAAVLFVLLAGVQYLKGKSIDYSIEFGVLWALITSTIFLATRTYYFKKNIACQVCNDLPTEKESE